MPKTIPVTEKREWLKRFEEGETAAQIKKSLEEAGSRYDLKTINSGIEWARSERAAANAREGLVRDRLQNHHDQLLKVVHNILSALELPDRYMSLWKVIKRNEQVFSTPVELPGALITHENDKGLVLKLKDEDSPLWELLREHMKYDRLWGTLNTWKVAATEHFQGRKELSLKIENNLKMKTGYGIRENADISGDTDSPTVFYQSTIDKVVQEAIYLALGGLQTKSLEELVTAVPEEGLVRFGGDVLVKCPGTEEECRKKVIEALEEALKSGAARKTEKTYGEIGKPMEKAKHTLEEIELLGMVPGTCRVCRRLGL